MPGATKLLTAGGGAVQIQPASSIASDVVVQVPSQNCTLLSSSTSNTATGSGSATAIGSNVYTNVVSNISLPNKSIVIVNFKYSTGSSNIPSDAAYIFYISTSAISSGVVAQSGGTGVYPKSGIAALSGTMTYVNLSGSTQNIWLAAYPYASANYNTPDCNVSYSIVSLA